MDEADRGGRSRSDQGDGIREVSVEEVQDLVFFGDFLKLIKGHEERTGERLVLEEKHNVTTV